MAWILELGLSSPHSAFRYPGLSHLLPADQRGEARGAASLPSSPPPMSTPFRPFRVSHCRTNGLTVAGVSRTKGRMAALFGLEEQEPSIDPSLDRKEQSVLACPGAFTSIGQWHIPYPYE